ncbi:hypothetical protein M885DRAFT_515175 [Pelagophyceae sp. CCMP2097]|nr:hypothetical protein M885DRAFT_515175 [Pelagophyceae sp. CCMP2097]
MSADMASKPDKEKKKKGKQTRKNQSSVDFVIVSTSGEVKEVVKKKSKAKEGDEPKKRARDDEASATPQDDDGDDDDAQVKKKKVKKAKKEADGDEGDEEAPVKKKKKKDKVEGETAEPKKKKKKDEVADARKAQLQLVRDAKKLKAELDALPPAPVPLTAEEEARARAVEATLFLKRQPADPNSTSSKNPNGVTRLFVGNLPWTADEALIASSLGLEKLEAVMFVTDKASGKFYGTAFVGVADAAQAAKAVSKAGTDVGGRAIKVNYAPPRPGDVWPPVAKEDRGAAASKARERTPRPAEGTQKLFLGNVAYEAADDDLLELFKTCAPDGVREIRWLTKKDTGEFRGCGFVVFHDCEAADAAVKLDGSKLKGRPIRIDYTE